ncbi:MAG: hypothetical protein ACR2PG_22325 [Hyphomicrobiaceae bacterium]
MRDFQQASSVLAAVYINEVKRRGATEKLDADRLWLHLLLGVAVAVTVHLRPIVDHFGPSAVQNGRAML